MAEILKVIVASTNPVKLEAARAGFTKMFPDSQFEFEGISVPSGVGDQPMTSQETRTGARNRAQNARSASPAAAYYVGLEGGVTLDDPNFDTDPHHLRSVVWCAILKQGLDTFGEAEPGSYALPPKIGQLIVDQKMELGSADDIVFQRTNSKQADGSIGILTHGRLTRGPYYELAVTLALIPFINVGLFPQN